jgi:hypothetical protein
MSLLSKSEISLAVARLPFSISDGHLPLMSLLGQVVEYTPPGGLYAPPGFCVVTAKLPERAGDFEYHIKHTSELHERIARESELREARR